MKAKTGLAAILLLALFTLNACAETAKAPETSKEGQSKSEVTGNLSTYDKTTNNNQNTMTTPQQSANDNSQSNPPAAGDKIATIETDMGTIKFRLFAEQVPEMVKNFETLANTGKYDGVPFHRVVQDFMIQTGDFTNRNGTGGYSYKGPGENLQDEIVPSLKHLYGTVSMANRGPNTNGSQFFVVTNKRGTAFLDGNYTIFGQVFEGMDVADKIAALQVAGTEKPGKEVLMKKVTVQPYIK